MSKNVKAINKCIKFNNISQLSLPLTLDCGQSFRWHENSDKSWHGVVNGKAVDVCLNKQTLKISGDVCSDDAEMWQKYFDLNRDYASICKTLSQDEKLKTAIDAYPGIRILKQDNWEALCSFIISQNNNIPRIKGIIERLCENFGEKISENDYSFPSAEKIAELNVEKLAPLRSGFRAKYIIDAAQKVAANDVNLISLETLPISEAREQLIKIKGVGAKVAECTLLYGCGRMDAFPIDVWVKRIMQELYPTGLPECTKNVEGIAQQFLFHWRRNL